MAVKVLIISKTDHDELEDSINQFLKGRSEGLIIDIKYSTNAAAIPNGYGETNLQVSHSALIYYKD